MFHLRLIICWCLFLTFLVLISSTTLKFLDFLPGLILMWSIVGLYYSGTYYNRHNLSQRDLVEAHFLISGNKAMPIVLAVIFTIFYPIYIQYYTGSSIYVAFFNIANGVSNYQNYQNYFNENDLGAMNLTKLPLVLGAGLLKFIFIFSMCRLVGFRTDRNWAEVLSVIVMVIATAVLAIARGTSFEFFELILLFVFCTLLRRRRKKGQNWFTKSSMLSLGSLGLAVIFLFSFNIGSRGSFECSTNELCYDKDGVIATNFPTFGLITYQLASYFLFGLYFVSNVITRVGLTSISGFFTLITPFGLNIFNNGETYKTLVCDKIIDCSVSWVPDVVSLLSVLGITGIIPFIFYVGYISRKVFYKANSTSISAAVLLYFVFIYMISLPVGNFITASSANILSILIAIICYFFPATEKILLKLFS